MRFLGIILRVLRLEVSVYNIYITNQFQPTFARGEGEVKSVCRGDCEYSKEENSEVFEDFCLNNVQEFGLWVQSQHPPTQWNVNGGR
jgi:hypothetical protein